MLGNLTQALELLLNLLRLLHTGLQGVQFRLLLQQVGMFSLQTRPLLRERFLLRPQLSALLLCLREPIHLFQICAT